jgi:hypothetical protein
MYTLDGVLIREPSNLYGRYEDAEAALLDAMRAESLGKAVTVKDVPLRLKFGKGRKRSPAQERG